jgi:hypothetical protein
VCFERARRHHAGVLRAAFRNSDGHSVIVAAIRKDAGWLAVECEGSQPDYFIRAIQ